MSICVCAVDTNIAFTKKKYYLRFKKAEIKYVPGHKQGRQDDLLLDMKKMREEEAFSLITDLLSTLSFNWNAVFHTDGGFINTIHQFDWENITCSASGIRQITANQPRDDFINICPLDTGKETTLARLYRTAKSSRNIYSQILFFWHCLEYSNDGKSIALIDKYVKDIKNVSVTDDIEQIMENPILYKENISQQTFGNYIQGCIRNAIAHIERKPNTEGRSITLDSLKELRHLSQVKDVLQYFAR